MANPQPDKFIKISTELFEQLCKIRISGESRQILDAIIRKTYGYNKKEDWISLSQFETLTRLSKVHICRGLRKLIDMNLITKKDNAITQKGNEWGATYCLQKDYENWKPLPKKVTLPKKVKGITKKGQRSLPKKVPTIDKHTIDNITIDNIPESSKKDSGQRKKTNPHPDQKKAEKYFCDKYQDLLQIKYDFKGAKDALIVKRLLGIFGIENFCLLVDEFLIMDDEFVRKKAGRTLGVLSAISNKVAQRILAKKDGTEDYSEITRHNIRVMREWLKETELKDAGK